MTLAKYGLIQKLNKLLPRKYAELVETYVSNRLFRIKQEDEFSELSQGSVLGPILYTCDLQIENIIIATFSDDTAIPAVGKEIKEATEKLQQAHF